MTPDLLNRAALTETDQLVIAHARTQQRLEKCERCLKEAMRILRWHGLKHLLREVK